MEATAHEATAHAVEEPTMAALMANALSSLVDSVADIDRMIASLSAHRAELMNEAARWSEVAELATTPTAASVSDARALARRVVVAELACALRMPERTIERMLHDSALLVGHLPLTLDALRTGAVSYRHAEVIADQADSLPVEALPAFEETVVPFARTHTATQSGAKARVTRERSHPDSIEVRTAARVEERTVELTPAHDGMAWLNLYLPADRALAAYSRATDLARGLQGPSEPRTLTQLRADALCDLLIDGETPEGLGRGVRATVHVTVPVLTLLGHGSPGQGSPGQGDNPAMLEGYGPIDVDTARRLTASAPSLSRLLTHPETGTVLSVGQKRYRVPEELKTWLRVRDKTCRFPGCGVSARHCDLDHSRDWQFGGDTAHDNLAHLCAKHHSLKHDAGWAVGHVGDGALEWTSPTGKKYVTEPAVRMGG